MTSRPTAAEIAAARDRTIPDVVPPRGGVLFCGINPGLYSAATGWHFARPGNRFWPALHRSGFTDRLLRPAEQDLLPSCGLGITNLAARATAQAAELTDEELAEGGALLEAFVERHAPRVVAVLGVTAYRTAFGRPKARDRSAGDHPGRGAAVDPAQPVRAERALHRRDARRGVRRAARGRHQAGRRGHHVMAGGSASGAAAGQSEGWPSGMSCSIWARNHGEADG